MTAFVCGSRALPWLLATAVALIAAWAAAPTALAAESITVTTTIPVGIVASSCTGDSVAVNGQIVETVTTTFSEGGTVHIRATTDFTAVTGVSLATGKRFRSDTISVSESTAAAGFETTMVVSARFVVSGEAAGINPLDPGDDFFLHQTMHTTVPAGGGAPVPTYNYRAGCQ